MKLSVIVATYDMQREAPRTLQSLLSPLQKAVSSSEYEVIVIDNGSHHELSLSGPDFANVNVRLMRVPPEEAHPSLPFAINDCVSRMANGRFVLVCIDGARMFSPYLVRRTLDALNRAPDAFTYVGSRHLGPDVQMKSIHNGYNESKEDELLQSVEWTQDLDRLLIGILISGSLPG